MSVTNLSNQHISASYQNLVQISSSNALYNGTGSLIPNLLVTASFALSASYFAGNSVSASYVKLAQSASYVLNAKSASFASTASYVQNSLTASYAQTASFAPAYLPLTGGTINGDVILNGTASIAFLNVTIESASVIYSSGSNQFGDATNDTQTLIGTVIVSGSQQITGSLSVSGSINNVDYIDFNTSASITQPIPGRLSWNDIDGTLNVGLKGSNVTLQVGQEEVIRVVNKTGGNLLESQYRAVRVRSVAEGGAQGQRLAVVLAQADNDDNSATTIGIVTENIDNNQEGFITTFGKVRGINTTGNLQGETWADGDIIYLSPTTPGFITNIKPQAPQHSVILGYVVYAHNNSGIIFVKVDNGYEIDELHNVRIDTGSLTSGQLLVRSGSVWTNSNQLTGSYGLTGSSSLIGTRTITGSLNVTGSTTLDNLLVLVPRTTTPTGQPTGSIIMSGSAAGVKPYYFNGTAFNPFAPDTTLTFGHESTTTFTAGATFRFGQAFGTTAITSTSILRQVTCPVNGFVTSGDVICSYSTAQNGTDFVTYAINNITTGTSSTITTLVLTGTTGGATASGVLASPLRVSKGDKLEMLATAPGTWGIGSPPTSFRQIVNINITTV
jgi:hypothetical protein